MAVTVYTLYPFSLKQSLLLKGPAFHWSLPQCNDISNLRRNCVLCPKTILMFVSLSRNKFYKLSRIYNLKTM